MSFLDDSPVRHLPSKVLINVMLGGAKYNFKALSVSNLLHFAKYQNQILKFCFSIQVLLSQPSLSSP